MTHEEREAMAEEGVRITRSEVWRARSFAGLRLDADELTSAGHQAVNDALATWDKAAGVPWGACVRLQVRAAVWRTVELMRSRRLRSLDAAPEEGDRPLLPRDPRAEDPALLAAARELVARVGRYRDRATTGEGRRELLHGVAVSEVEFGDVRAVATQLVTRAVAGDVPCAVVVAQLVAGRNGGTP